MNKKIYSLYLASLLLVSSLSANVGLAGGFYSNDKVSDGDADGIGLNLSIDYNQKINQNVDITYGLSYGNQKLKDISRNFDYFLVKINGEYNINSQFYTFAGLNLPIALASIKVEEFGGEVSGSAKYTGEIGFQLGAGININENIAIELGYQAINAKRNSTLTEFGFQESASSSTEIAEAITINTKYTF